MQQVLLERMKELFLPFTIKVTPAKAYKIHDLEKVAIMGNREYIDDVETISGWIAEKNKWKLEEFYD